MGKSEAEQNKDEIQGSIKEMGQDVEAMQTEYAKATVLLTGAIRDLSTKIDTLVSTHLKIIYWLLIIIGSAFLGVKSAEAFKLIFTK